MRRCWWGGSTGLALGLLLAAAGGGAAAAAERVALVIGNGAYRHAPPLPNPPNDARAIAEALKRVGFEVVEGADLDIEGMRSTIGAFEKALARGDAKVGLVFYAGHGMQVNGENYLIPVDAELETSSDLKFKTVAASWLLDEVLGSGEEGRVSIVMLDACRDNPLTRSFAKRTRSATGSSLADITAADGAYIAFATAPGNVAEDGAGANSPFTTAVLRNIARPGVEINSMMNAVRGEVYARTEKRQRPYATSALLGDFYFVPPPAAAAPADPLVAATPPAGRPGEPQLAALPPAQETVLRSEPAPPPQQPQPPSAEELRVSALQRVENALLQSEGARRNLQRDLAALGHLSGRADGRFGPGTRDAVRGFQAVAKLDPTGYVDRPTLDALRAQVARLQPAEEEQPRRPLKQQQARPRPEPTPAAEPEPVPVEAAPAAARAYSGMTMGVCTTPGGGWASERHLTFAQCRKLGGAFEPF
jgi:hypothetical protein